MFFTLISQSFGPSLPAGSCRTTLRTEPGWYGDGRGKTTDVRVVVHASAGGGDVLVREFPLGRVLRDDILNYVIASNFG